MSSEDRLNIPPVFPPPPRRVRRTVGSGCALALPRLFVLPHMIIGVLLLLYAPVQLYVEKFGTPVVATIDNCETRLTRKGGRMYVVHYHFTHRGTRYDDSPSIGESAFANLHVGDRIPGRTSPLLYLASFQNQHFICSAWSDGPLIIPVLIAIVWNGLLSVFVYRFWIVPFLDRELVRNGSVTTGKVTSFRSAGRGGRRVTYSFQDARGKLFAGSQNVDSGLTAQAGMPCSIFYMPTNSRRNIAYEFSGLRVLR
jgi:hypothetical protein